jgi:hypothetical protein
VTLFEYGGTGYDWRLYIDGVDQGAPTPAGSDVAATTVTNVNFPRLFSGNPSDTITMAEVALFADLSSLGDHATIQAVLMNLAGGAAMKRRWNV